jgi:hypothetical protein
MYKVRNLGACPNWSTGVMEYWNGEMMILIALYFPILHYSNTPTLRVHRRNTLLSNGTLFERVVAF